MNSSSFNFNIEYHSDIPTYQQLVNFINDATAKKAITICNLLPSFTASCKELINFKDTVFRVYSLLKGNGGVAAVPNKGFYLGNGTKKLLLVADTFKPCKEVLYYSFINNLWHNIITNVQFHHHNIDHFKTIRNNSLVWYIKHLVMNFVHKDVPCIELKINNEKLVLINRNIYSRTENNYVFQDFGKSLYSALNQAESPFRNNNKIHFVYPEYTNHPTKTITFLKKFCYYFRFKYQIITK